MNAEQINPTSYEQSILARFDSLNLEDFRYFTGLSEQKISDLGLKPDCKIWQMFTDSHYPRYHQCEYCLKNCGLKCVR